MEDTLSDSLIQTVIDQFNERLQSVADGSGAAQNENKVYLDEHAVKLLAVGLDIDTPEMREFAHAAAHQCLIDVIDGIAGDRVPCLPVQIQLEQLFIAGCLHERERARREAAE